MSAVAGLLAKKHHLVPERAKETISQCKESNGFKLGLQRSGQVTYQYKYLVALGCF